MASPVFEKLKAVIDLSVLSDFDIKDLTADLYIPVCVSKGMVYVVVTAATKQDVIRPVIESKLCTNRISFKVCSDEDFNEILNYVRENHVFEDDSDEIEVIEDIEDIENIEDDDVPEVRLKYENDDMEEMLPIDEIAENELVQINEQDEHDSTDESDAPSNLKFQAIEIGQILVQMGVATQEQIFNALVEAKKQKLPLGTMLVQMGTITLDELKQALSLQQ